MWDAFISHASQDVAAALRLERSLSASGVSTWIDRDNIRDGGLLIPTLQLALQESRNIVVLWSNAAAVSPWVTTEWTSVVNLNHQKETKVQKGVIPCRVDDTPLALFLLNYVFCDLRTSFDDGAASLVAALRGDVEQTPPPARYQPSDFVLQIIAGQDDVLTALGSNDPSAAQQLEAQLTRLVDAALRKSPGDPYWLALAGYDKKNQYLIRHWKTLQAGRLAPRDVLLDEATELFFKVLSMRPEDPSALNGLGSVFMLRGDFHAAEFYIRRSLVRAREEGFDYPAADQDLQLLQYMKGPESPAPSPRKRSRTANQGS
jgi:tetratricopeptide (TPR) repeat protein